MSELMNVDKAIAAILKQIPEQQIEMVALMEALNRRLADDIIAPLDLPPFANSAMDGYAIHSRDSVNASHETPVTLKVTMDIAAGNDPAGQLTPGTAARIMTGAPIPDGADAVIPVEDTDSIWSQDKQSTLPDTVRLFRSVTAGQHIRQAGENIRSGERILATGTHIGAAEIGMLAAIGQASVPVIHQPRVAILSNGDELLTVEQPLTPGKIRDVNSYTLAALVTQAGGIAHRMPIAGDTEAAIRQLFTDTIAIQPDMIISSAGVSAGARDLVRTLLKDMGEINFWKINMRPGKPLAFGKLHDIPFFGLPGNPVSAMVTFEILVRPALEKMGGISDNHRYETAILQDDLQSDGRRSYIRVTLERDNKGQLLARTTGTQSSGALMSMVMADALMIIPEGVYQVEAGTAMRVKLLKSIV